MGKSISFLFSFSIAFTISASTDFRKKYEVNEPLKKVLDEHAGAIAHKLKEVRSWKLKKHGVWRFSWLPDYYVKFNLARIHGMEKMKSCIAAKNLDLLKLPDKRIYHVKGTPRTLNNYSYAVVIEKVKAQNRRPLNLKQIQQMCKLIKETGYISMTSTNYIRTEGDTITLIDTEGTFNRNELTMGFMRLLGGGHNLNEDFTPEALKYIIEELVNITPRSKCITVYNEAKKVFARQKAAARWDYRNYFKHCMRARLRK